LKTKGRVVEISGTYQIQVPLLYGNNTTLKWFNKGSTFSLADSNFMTMAYTDWRFVGMSIVRFYTEDLANRGKYQALNYINAKLDGSNNTLNTELENVLFTGDNLNDKPYGLETLIAAAPTTGTIMGINRATAGNEYWRNQTADGGAHATDMLSDMASMKRAVMQYTGANWGDYALFTDGTVYGYYEGLTYTHYRIFDNKIADLGFGGLRYDGVPLMWSPSATAGSLYFINAKHIQLYIDPDQWMTMTDWKSIPDQLDRVAQLKSVLQLVINRACNHGVIYTIT
jgi:hypothetical protein